MNANQKELTIAQKTALEEINEHLGVIKQKIKDNWGVLDSDKELILFIKDKQSSPWRKQTEDIEGDLDEMRMLSR